VFRVAGASGRPPVGSFAVGLVGRSNAFGLLRLVLAVLVIVSHAFPISGWGEDPVGPLTRGQAELGDLAVVGFFALSGYLITRSAQRTPPTLYLWRRFLRIMPAFWFVLLFTAVVIGPIYYTRQHGNLIGYFEEPDGPASFVGANVFLLMRRFTIHDVFVDSPIGAATGIGVLNGSLWTLFFEVLCYLIVGGLAALGLLSARFRWSVPAAALLCYLVSAFGQGWGISGFTVPELARLGSVFLSGATIAVFAERIPFDGRIAILCVLLVIMTAAVGGLRTLGYASLTYVILWVAGAAPTRLHRIGSVNDLSYGVYIFAWPVQMALTAHGVQAWGFGWYLVACLLGVFPLAAASWWLVEKPAMSLKDAPPWEAWRARRFGNTTSPID
jgi:peptidoglycan/LPS O-acetylase OafA/YrhL